MDCPSPTTPVGYKNKQVGPKSFTFDKLTKEMNMNKTQKATKSPRGLGGKSSASSPKPNFKTTTIKKVNKKINISTDLSVSLSDKDSPSPKQPETTTPTTTSPDIVVSLNDDDSPAPPLPKSLPPPIPTKPLPIVAELPSTPAPILSDDEEEEEDEEEINEVVESSSKHSEPDSEEEILERPLTPLNRKPSLKKVKQQLQQQQQGKKEENFSEDPPEEDVAIFSPELNNIEKSNSRSFIQSPTVLEVSPTTPLSHSYSPSTKLRSSSSAKLNRLMRLSVSMAKMDEEQKSPPSGRSKSNSVASSNSEKFTTQGCSSNWKIQMQYVQKEPKKPPQLSPWRSAIHQIRMNINQ